MRRYLLQAALHLNVCVADSEYKAIVNPMDIQTSSAVFWTCLKAVSIWLLSGHRDNMNVTSLNCVPYPLSNQMHPKIHSVMIFLVYFLIPLTIISVYYYHIARTLIKSAHEMPGEVSEHTKRQGFSAFYCWTSLEIGRQWIPPGGWLIWGFGAG
ncbi:hypothetical protein XENOCAPTIV_014488 [Xenoophorus captivus]|uniref:Uncharacterized protein n=1 Tax=Xenoophorus captivus TaxID=1517983 RepID=A0ABV0QRV9_9TELE